MEKKEPTIRDIYEKIYDNNFFEFMKALLQDPYGILFDRRGFVLPSDCEEKVEYELQSVFPDRKAMEEAMKYDVPGIQKIEPKTTLPKEEGKSK